VFSDELNHVSMIEGIRHSRAPKLTFAHNDPTDLDRKLAALDPGLPKLVAFESVYSMDGDIAPIGELCDVATAHGAMTNLDEVHAVGLYGPRGGGIAERDGHSQKLTVILCATNQLPDRTARHRAIAPDTLAAPTARRTSAIWSRRWRPSGRNATCDGPHNELRRTVRAIGDGLASAEFCWSWCYSTWHSVRADCEAAMRSVEITRAGDHSIADQLGEIAAG
jgi:hypothetical protein